MMKFDLTTEVQAPAQRVWAKLWDFERLIRCIPGVEAVTAVEEHRIYTARIVQRLGPFRVGLDVRAEITGVTESEQLVAEITGADSFTGSTLKQSLAINLSRGAAGATSIQVSSGVTILGKLAVLGHGIIERKANEIMTTFSENLRRDLEGEGTNAPAV